MNGSKRSRWRGCRCGLYHNSHCTFGERKSSDIRWQDIRKRLHNEFFFSNAIKFRYDPHNFIASFYLDGELLLEVPCMDDYGLYRQKGHRQYATYGLLRIIEDHFNVEKKELINYTLDENVDPLGIHVLLKCADRRIGVRRLRDMYQDLFFEQLLGGGNVGPAIKVLQKRIKTKNLFINEKTQKTAG